MSSRLLIDTEKAKELYDRGFDDQEIADKLGFTRTAIGRWRRRNGLPFANNEEERQQKLLERRSPTETQDMSKMITVLYEQGLLDWEIGHRIGVSAGAVRNWRERRDLPCNGGRVQHKPYDLKPEKKAKKGKELTPMQRIEEITRRANALHLTYGEYVAQFGGLV